MPLAEKIMSWREKLACLLRVLLNIALNVANDQLLSLNDHFSKLISGLPETFICLFRDRALNKKLIQLNFLSKR